MQVVVPPVLAYNPAMQSVHLTLVDAFENFPMAHTVQVLAPEMGPVLVIDPAEQLVHSFTVDAVEYLPAAHAVQMLAPTAAPVFVMDPAEQTSQTLCPSVG